MRRRSEGGFTLLEIIVALAIAATGIMAVARYTASAADVSYQTEERLLAVWAAGNRLSELRIKRAWPAPGSADLEVRLGGRTWYLTQTTGAAGHEDLRRVDVVVYTDPGRTLREFGLHGYLARHRPAESSGPTPPDGGLPGVNEEQDFPGGSGDRPGSSGEAG